MDSEAPDHDIQIELEEWLARGGTEQSPVRYGNAGPADRVKWLKPALRRFAWMGSRDLKSAGASERYNRLKRLCQLALNRLAYSAEDSVDMLTLEMIAGSLPELEAGDLSLARQNAARLLLNEKQWSPSLCIALHHALRNMAPDSSPHHQAGRALAWRLFVDPDDPDDGDPCWSASTRIAIRALPQANRKRWLALFTLASTQLGQDPTAKWRDRVGAAVGRIGLPEVESFAGQSLSNLKARPRLEFAGQVLLAHWITIGEITGSAPLRQSLAAISGTEWDSERTVGFVRPLLPRLVAVLASRPAMSQAIERLVTQSWAEGIPEVSRAAEEILRKSYAESETGGVGIDGYGFPGDEPRRMLQQRIDSFLRSRESGAHSIDPRVETAMLLQEDSNLKGELLNAVSARIEWLKSRIAEAPQMSLEWSRFMRWNEDLATLRASLLRGGVEVDVGDLLRLLDQDLSESAFHRVMQHTEEHGSTPEIIGAVQRFHKKLYGTIALQTMRRHVGWWLWLEDLAPVNPQDCWSSIVRIDLRAMDAERRSRWRQLLSNVSFASGGRIPAKWSKQARPALDAVGIPDFRAQILRWFAPFGGAAPLKLTSEGGDALRNLVWYCSMLPVDGEIDKALLSIENAPWKTKQSRDRLAKVIPAIDEERRRRGAAVPVREDTAGTAAPKVSKRTPIMLGLMGTQVVVQADHILVQGKRRQYRIDFNRRITDQEGRRWSVDVEPFEGPMEAILKASIDTFVKLLGAPEVDVSFLVHAALVLSDDIANADRIRPALER